MPYIDKNQPQVYMCPPILNPPPNYLPTPSLWVVREHHFWVPCFMHPTCTGHLFYIWEYTCLNAILSNHPTLAFSHWVQKSVLYICVSFSALHVGSSVSSLSIPCICISIRHLSSFWLTSLCIIGSGFIHLIRTDSKALRLQLLLPHSLVVGTIFGVWFSHCPLVSQYMT